MSDFAPNANQIANAISALSDGKNFGRRIVYEYRRRETVLRGSTATERTVQADKIHSRTILFSPQTFLNSTNGQSVGIGFGASEDKPTPADYDGDGQS